MKFVVQFVRKSFIFLLPALLAVSAHPSAVVINEYFPNPNIYAEDEQMAHEWVELYNPSDQTEDISGFRVTDSTHKETLLDEGTVLEPHAFLVVSYVGMIFNNDGDAVVLYDSEGAVVEYEVYDIAPKGYSKARSPDGGPWSSIWTSEPTPGSANVIASPQDQVVSVDLPTGPEGSFLFASWNIENLGTTKVFDRPLALRVIVRTLIQYDIVAVQELSSKPPEGGVCGEQTSAVVCRLLDQINEESENVYAIEVSGRVGGQEQYFVLYRTDLFELQSSYLYGDWNFLFSYPPFITKFVYSPTSDSFYIVDVHTSPSHARDEIFSLPNLLDDCNLLEENLFIVGDLNADQGAVQTFRKSRDWPIFFSLLPEGWQQLIPDSDITTVLSRNNYDKIISSPSAASWRVQGTGGPFRVDVAWNFSTEDTRKYSSDHYPVQVVLFPGTPGAEEPVVQKHLDSSSRSKLLPFYFHQWFCGHLLALLLCQCS